MKLDETKRTILFCVIVWILAIVSISMSGCAHTRANPETKLTLVCNSDFPDRCWRDAHQLCVTGYEVVSKNPLIFECE